MHWKVESAVRYRVGRQSAASLTEFVGRAFQKLLGKFGDVFPSVTQRRKHHRQNIQPME
jgi:hypothetical protein